MRPREWIVEMIQFMQQIGEELEKSGELVSSMGLADPSQARTVRISGGIPVPTDGPFAESKESLAGFWVVDVENEGRAIEIVQRVVAFTEGPMEIGPYQVQAAIAACHDEARTAAETDWPQILALYELLEQVSPGPVVTMNRAVAVSMVHGPRAGLALLGTLDGDDGLAQSHRLEAVRAHLLERAGDLEAARAAYQQAARMTASIPERRHLSLRAASLGAQPTND